MKWLTYCLFGWVAGRTGVVCSITFQIRGGYKQMSKCWHSTLTFNLPDIPLLCISVIIYVFLLSSCVGFRVLPLCVKPHNIIDLDMLRAIVSKCQNYCCGMVYKAIFLTGFFGFLR